MTSYTGTVPQASSHEYPLKWGALVTLVVVTALAAVLGSVGSISAPTFYLSLNRPAWAPPPSVFGPAWTLLYLLMAIASWVVVRVDGATRARPKLALYVLQLLANALWSWLFFHFHNGAAAFGEVLVLWLLVAATLVTFWRTHWVAGALFVPYLAWVSFASALTWSVWQANLTVL